MVISSDFLIFGVMWSDERKASPLSWLFCGLSFKGWVLHQLVSNEFDLSCRASFISFGEGFLPFFRTSRRLLFNVVLSVSPSSERMTKGSDEGLMLETSAFQIFHGGNSTFINPFHKTKFLF